jgi:hypothetical protein
VLPHFLGNITLSATVVVSRCVDHRKLSGERPGQYWGGDPPKAGRAGQGVHRLAPGGIGCTRESHRRPPAGLAAHGNHTDGPPAGLVAHGNYTDGPRRDWLHTGITQTSPRRDWLHTGTTKRGPRRDWLHTGCSFVLRNFSGPCSKIRPNGRQLENLFWETKKRTIFLQNRKICVIRDESAIDKMRTIASGLFDSQHPWRAHFYFNR